MFKRLVLALAAVCIMLPSTVLASGFAINEQGAKALGMGGAFVAQADDATAVYYNPAGITQLEGTQLSVGMSFIRPATSFKADTDNGRDSETKDQTFAIPTLYIASKINDKISVGFGAFVNFGLGMDWKDNWDGAHLPGGANAEIQTVSANPTVAFAVTKDFSVAAGLVYQTLDVTIESITPANQVFVSQPLKLEGDSDAISWNIAAHYKLGNNLRFGISYRPEVKHEVEGRGKTASLIPDLASKFKADLTLPAVTQLGVAWTNNKWTVELDGQYTEWSSYDELNPKGLAIGVREKNWDDVWAIRLGTQYQFNEKLALRAGIVRDYSPVPSETIDPMLPTGDRWLYTVGFGYKFNESLTLDFAYNYLDDESRRFDNKSGDIFYGTQGSPRVTGKFEDPDAHIFAMSVNYKF